MVAPGLRRAGAIVVLLGVLVVLMIGYGLVTPEPALGSYPSTGDIVVDYGQHVGDRVEVKGTVIRTDPAIIEDEYDIWVGDRYQTGTVRIRITGLERSVRPGQELWVFGVAQPDGNVEAINSVVVPAGARLYTYAISALAGVWVLYRLLRGWSFNRTTLALTPRETPLDRDDVVALLMGNEVDPDA